MIDVVARGSYTEANISLVIAHAGVSRPTFYDYFADKHDCFLAALAEIQEEMIERARQVLATEPPHHAAAATVMALVEFARSQPVRARFAMNEPLGAGRPALDARDRSLAELAQLVEETEKRAPSTARIPDLPTATLLGGVCRLLAQRLRRGEPDLSGVSQDLLSWVLRYARPTREQHWRTLQAERSIALQPQPGAVLLAPPRLGPGRPRLSSDEVLHSHRQRILLATAEVAGEKGFVATTVTDISRRAGVDGRTFYRLFRDKQEVFTTVHELSFQHLMAITASAFFTGENWPERIWKAVEAFARVLDGNPTLAYYEFVESHAGGQLGMQRFNDATTAFTIFLEEGFQQELRTPPPPRLALEAIVATSFEAIYSHIRADDAAPIAGLVPQLARLSLEPFVGADEVDELIGAAGRRAAQRS
jgi:AcrR family transcriptional regulator